MLALMVLAEQIEKGDRYLVSSDFPCLQHRTLKIDDRWIVN